MTIEVALLISLVTATIAITGALSSLRDKSHKKGVMEGAIQETLNDIKKKIDEMYIDKKSQEKKLYSLEQSAAVFSRDLKTLWNKLDDVQDEQKCTRHDLAAVQQDIELLNAKLCKEGKQYVE